jgi:hypothetical protein
LATIPAENRSGFTKKPRSVHSFVPEWSSSVHMELPLAASFFLLAALGISIEQD